LLQIIWGNVLVLDSKSVAAKWYVGELPGEEMPGIACEALELGHDGQNLRQLAGLRGPARRDILEIVDGAMRELGVEAPITKRDAALWLARDLAIKILDGRIEPYAGACRIWLSYSFAASELEHWSNLATGYELAAETGELKKAKQQIVEAARILSSTRK
jgi:hypothetical protein